jgi:hypothetical protein
LVRHLNSSLANGLLLLVFRLVVTGSVLYLSFFSEAKGGLIHQ